MRYRRLLIVALAVLSTAVVAGCSGAQPTTTSTSLEPGPTAQAVLDAFTQLGQRYADTLEQTSALYNDPDPLWIEGFTALAKSAEEVTVPAGRADLGELQDHFIGACENMVRAENLQQEYKEGVQTDLSAAYEKLEASSEAAADAFADFAAFEEGLEGLGGEIPWERPF